MANPNILSATSVLGNVSYVAPAGTGATTLLTNAANSNTILKVNSLTCTNVTGSTVAVTVSVNSAAAGGGTAFRLAFQMPVPANSSLQVIDKNNFVYLPENTSIVVTSATGAAIEYVTSFETIS